MSSTTREIILWDLPLLSDGNRADLMEVGRPFLVIPGMEAGVVIALASAPGP